MTAGVGAGWSEWELVETGKPRFAGHYQPILPARGYTDETDPDVMRRAGQAAASAEPSDNQQR